MTSEEVVTRGKELYEQTIRSEVEAGNTGKFLAIDVETGEYLLAETRDELTQRLFERGPKAERYLMRIGSPVYLYRGSGRMRRND